MWSDLLQESQEGGLPLGGALVDAGVLQHLGKDQTGLLLHDVQGVIRRDGVLGPEALGPVSVLFGAFVAPEVGAAGQSVGHGGELLLQPGGGDGQTHDR